jgi:hypothetical protein
MSVQNKFFTPLACSALLAMTLGVAVVGAQDMPVTTQDKPAAPEVKVEVKTEKQDAEKQDAAKSDKKEKEPAPTGVPVLWRDPGDVASRNLLLGRGGAEMKPDLSNVTFMEEETGGYSPKFRVKDGAGRVWVAKMGKEAQPETVAARLVWAVGFVGETNYLAPCVVIKGAPEPKKEVDKCEGGKGFANVRFEARPEGHKRLEEWKWNENQFATSREMKGLIVLMALINNWDLKDSNNKVVYVPNGEGGQGELHYIISDLGATFGKTGNFITHNRNEPKDYAKSDFIEKAEGGRVAFGYDGKNQTLLSDIKVEDAKWIGGLLSKLTDEQLQDAFRAANYGPEDVQLLTAALRTKINQLASL